MLNLQEMVSHNMPYLKRHLTQTILRAAATFPAVLITGARQTGKTTLLRREFGASHRYLSLERPDIRARAQADPIAFLAEASTPQNQCSKDPA